MSIVKAILSNLLSKAGYHVIKKNNESIRPDSMEAGLERLRVLNINPDIIVDLGAAKGTWTEKALRIWPDSKFELVEPLIEQAASLETLKMNFKNVNYHISLAGAEKSNAKLNVSPDLDGSGVYGEGGDNVRVVHVTTVDDIVADSPGFILMKFDTHGYELPILKGCEDSLKRAGALIIEVYGFKISPTCLLFHELSSYLDNLGFRLVDLVDIIRRPSDSVFWQADAIYLRKEHPAFLKVSYA